MPKSVNLLHMWITYQIFSIWWNLAELICLFKNLWEIHFDGPTQKMINLIYYNMRTYLNKTLLFVRFFCVECNVLILFFFYLAQYKGKLMKDTKLFSLTTNLKHV